MKVCNALSTLWADSSLPPHTPRSASASCVMDFSPSPSAPALGGLPRHGPYRPRLIACNSS